MEVTKYIDIIKYEKKQLKLIKTFTFDLKNNGAVLNLVYKNSKRYSIIIILNNNIQIIEINNKLEIENLVAIDNKLYDFLKFNERPKKLYEEKDDCQPCTIIKDINKDYLYIIKNNKNNKESDLAIIDLFKKEIFKFVNFTFLVRSLVKWNNNNIIFISLDSFYIFDIKTYQITTKYLNIDNNIPIYYAKPFFSREHKLQCLFLLIRELIYYFNNI